MENFKKACTEILELIKYLPDEEYSKIPQEEIDFYNLNKDLVHTFKFDESLPFHEQAILPETNAMLIKLFVDYFCDDEQRKNVTQILKLNDKMNNE